VEVVGFEGLDNPVELIHDRLDSGWVAGLV
jgi:hypothetical protein